MSHQHGSLLGLRLILQLATFLPKHGCCLVSSVCRVQVIDDVNMNKKCEESPPSRIESNSAFSF